MTILVCGASGLVGRDRILVCGASGLVGRDRILVCGASGLVGRDLCDLFERENIHYDGTYHTCTDRAFCERDNMFRVDFTNPSDVSDFFTKHGHRWLACVFLVVQRMVDVCEKDWNAIMHVNVDAVDTTSSLCHNNGIYFIHLSTDYVFDGTTSPYSPDAQVNPIQNYGITKLLSECRVRKNYATSPNYCIIRTPVLYSGNKASPLYDNAVTVLSKDIMDLRVHTTTELTRTEDDYYIRRPVYIPDLCIFIRAVAILAMGAVMEGPEHDTLTRFSGIYHFYNPGNCFTKYQMTKAIAEYLELSHLHIVPSRPDEGTAGGIYHAKRPYDTQLIDSRYNIENFFSHSFTETLPHVFSRFKHPKIGVATAAAEGRGDNTYFIMFDLDGTLVHTSYAHYRSYLEVFRNRGLLFMSYTEWNKYINYKNIHTYLETVAAQLAGKDMVEIDRILSDMRNEKLEAFKIYAPMYITPTKHAIDMLRFIQANPTTINAVVVTNSSQATTNIIRGVVPELDYITKWCVRETYTAPKPHPECYAMAVELYYREEKYIIGFENTSIGYESLRHVTPIVYLYIDEHDEYAKQDKWYYKKDAFYFDDFRCV
jgi:dTDP-4-dehydrorhamnose reductase/beta-phosphoglucomutase-like phosphatase (HAD superfamily)